MREPGAAVQRRQGLGRAAAPGRQAFAPARLPFPVMHVDTGHNFPEVIAYRDEFVDAARRSTSSSAACRTSIDDGRVVEEHGPARQPQPAADP